MNHAQKGIITLLRSAITGEKLPIAQDFDLEKEYLTIKRHHIHALIYEGAINCGLDQDTPSMKRLFKGYLKSLQISERQMKSLGEVFKAFDGNKISYLPVKGCVMKGLYPKRELRTMGDADVLIKTDEYAAISKILTSLGFTEGEEGEKHIVWQSDSLNLELHKRLFESKHKSLIRYFEDGWKVAKCDTGTRFKMDDENSLAFLFSHFANHFAYEGIGCRHVVDLWVYLKNHPALDENRLLDILSRFGLSVFYKNIRKMIAVWFEDEQEDEKSDLITQTIFLNGSWGESKNRIISQGVKDMGKRRSTFLGKIAYILRCAFPGKAHMITAYSFLRSRPFLLPFMYPVRILQKLFSVKSVIKNHKNSIKLLEGDELDKRKAVFEYLGLFINK